MAIRKPFQKLCYYHIYNRGHQKQKIFYEEKDYKKFISLINTNKKRFPNIEIIEYCLIPNHFHFIIQSKREGYDISNFIRNICAVYGPYYFYNYSQQYKVPMLKGRFKAKLLNNLKYLETCIYYVQHNAVKHEIVKKREEWKRSSKPYNNKIIQEIETPAFELKEIE